MFFHVFFLSVSCFGAFILDNVGAKLVHSWSKVGAFLVQSWRILGAKLVHSWCKVGAILGAKFDALLLEIVW